LLNSCLFFVHRRGEYGLFCLRFIIINLHQEDFNPSLLTVVPKSITISKTEGIPTTTLSHIIWTLEGLVYLHILIVLHQQECKDGYKDTV